MKRLITKHAAIAICAMAAFFLTSCIYDSAGDKFYRTLWEAEKSSVNARSDSPDENSWAAGMTVEFLCSQSISIKTSNSPLINFGTYESHQLTAIFHDLTLEIDDQIITFIDAIREGDTLFLRWVTTWDKHKNPGSALDIHTTILSRLSTYK